MILAKLVNLVNPAKTVVPAMTANKVSQAPAENLVKMGLPVKRERTANPVFPVYVDLPGCPDRLKTSTSVFSENWSKTQDENFWKTRVFNSWITDCDINVAI